MLDLGSVDLSELCSALQDHTYEHRWWIDPATGEIGCHSEDIEGETLDDLDARGVRFIDPEPSSEGYEDMAAFVRRVGDRRSRDLLESAIAGRGAFRRFKDTLFEFPDLRAAWFEFRDARAERRALRWLADTGLIESAAGDAAIAAHPDTEMFGPPTVNGDAVASAVAADLRILYANRLQGVILFGSWARGDAHPESDVDLVVVLDEVASPWDELSRMEPVLERHSDLAGTIVTAIPVSADAYQRGWSSTIVRAKTEGREVA